MLSVLALEGFLTLAAIQELGGFGHDELGVTDVVPPGGGSLPIEVARGVGGGFVGVDERRPGVLSDR